MDHSHAHAVFIEISFGLNTVFTIYQDFSGLVTELVDGKIGEFVAKAKAIEGTSSEKSDRRFETVRQQLSKIKEGHVRLQKSLYRLVVGFAIACAFSGLAILYFDWIVDVGWWCGLLVSPILVYLAISLFNVAVFWVRGRRKLARLKNYHGEFDPPKLPPVPNGDGVDDR